jgi:hypothetical protein
MKSHYIYPKDAPQRKKCMHVKQKFYVLKLQDVKDVNPMQTVVEES